MHSRIEPALRHPAGASPKTNICIATAVPSRAWPRTRGVPTLHRESGNYSSRQRLVVRPDGAAGLGETLLPLQLNPTAACVERRACVVASLHTRAVKDIGMNAHGGR